MKQKVGETFYPKSNGYGYLVSTKKNVRKICYFFGKTGDELFSGFHGYFWNQRDIEQNFNYQGNFDKYTYLQSN